MPVTLTKRTTKSSLPDRISANLFDTFIIIVPTKRRIRHLTRELLWETKAAISELHIFTLQLLAAEVMQKSTEVLRIVDGPILTLLFEQAIASLRNELQYFGLRGKNLQVPRGTLQKIIAVVRKLKEVGVYPEELSAEITLAGEEERPKLQDIAAIYAAYEENLANLTAVDAEGIFKTLQKECSQQKFEQAFRQLFPNVEEISIVGFDEFTNPELSFIQKICTMNLAVSLVFDFQLGNPALFGHLEENYRQFLELGFSHQQESDVDPKGSYARNENAAVAHLHVAQNIFKRAEQIVRRDLSKSITIARTKDRIREVEFICKLVKQLVADNPQRNLSRICVASYAPETYAYIAREQFKKFGIPANVTDRFALAQSPVVVSIVGLLEIATRCFRRDDVLRTLHSTYFSFGENGELLDRSNLANVSRELRITVGLRSWLSKIEHHISRLQHLTLMSTDEDRNHQGIRDIEKLKKAAQDIQWLDALLRDIASDQTPGGFQQRLQALLEQLKLSRQIVAGDNPEIVEKDARAYARFLEVVEQTMDLLEYQEGKEKKRSLKFYVEQLKVALAEERYNVREQFGTGVLVTSIDETRGLPLDVMIVAGLVDGEFPSVYQSEIFFSNTRRKEREQHHIWENRYLFYQAATNWSEHLYLTYPEQDADLDLVRSSFVDALKNTADVEELEYPAGSPFENTIYSREDLLIHHGDDLRLGSGNSPNIPPSMKSEVERVKHSIEVEKSRISLNSLPEYAGRIFDSISDDAKEVLETLRHRVYSVSQLETYGRCPFQFFAQRLLRLIGVEELEEEFSPMEKGSILHETMFEFYTERREKNLPMLLNCSEEDFEFALRQLLRIAERKLSEVDIPDAFWDLEKELILGDKETGRGVLREFLEFERGRSTSFQPKYFEVGFGSELGSQTRIDTTLSSEEPVAAGNVLLRGKVDRVEVGAEAFAIIDYKTGSTVAKLDEIRSGISLQLPIYLFTIEKMLTEKLGRTLNPAGGLYYQLRNPVALKVGVGNAHYKEELDAARSRSNLLPTDAELRGLIGKSIRLVNTYVDDIAQGRFPLTTEDKIDKVCSYCEYKTICRIQSVRRVEQAQSEAL